VGESLSCHGYVVNVADAEHARDRPAVPTRLRWTAISVRSVERIVKERRVIGSIRMTG
jgi:hypothetical protein